MAKQWAELGANCIGGCCRTTPSTIAALKAAFEILASTVTGHKVLCDAACIPN